MIYTKRNRLLTHGTLKNRCSKSGLVSTGESGAGPVCDKWHWSTSGYNSERECPSSNYQFIPKLAIAK